MYYLFTKNALFMYSRIKSFKYSIVWSTVLYGIIVPPPPQNMASFFCCICATPYTVTQWQWLYLSALYLSLSSLYAGKQGGSSFLVLLPVKIVQLCTLSTNTPFYILCIVLVHQNPPFHTALNYRRNKIYSNDTNGISVIISYLHFSTAQLQVHRSYYTLPSTHGL